MRYRRPTMSAIRDQRTSRAFLALTVLLALVWPVSVAASALADGPAAHIAAATSPGLERTMVRQHGWLGGLVANRRDRCGRYGAILLGMRTGAPRTVLLVAAGLGSSAAARPRRWSQPALVDARAPPSLQFG